MERWTVEDYKKLYKDIVSMSIDCDSFPLGVEILKKMPEELVTDEAIKSEEITEEFIEKAKYIGAMLQTLNDVPQARLEWYMELGKLTEEDIDNTLIE